MSSKISHLRQFGKFRLDAKKRVLWCEDEPVNLALKEIELLCVLTENGGEVVKKDELLDKVWADSFVEESNLSRHIYVLRKTFKDFGEERELIQTVPRRGYRFAGEIREIENGNGELVIEKHTSTRTLIEIEESAESVREQTSASTKIGGLPFQRFAVFSVATVLLVALIGGFAFWFRQNQPARASAVEIKSIAVLPLKSFAAQKDEQLRLRIADALITRLGKLPEIAVRPTNSILRFAKEETSATEAGKKLSVDAVLEGRIQIENERLRVTLQLVSVRTGEQIWAGQFDGKTNEILNLQDKISAQLLPRLSQTATLAKNPTTSAEAYENYLKGRYLWNKRLAPEMKKAVEYFEQAVTLDPNFALAYAGLADAYSMLANHGALPVFEAYAKAKLMTQKALSIEPNLSEAYSALGWILYEHEWNWAEAERAFARAIELNPHNAEAHHWRGLNFLAQGKTEEYFAAMESARQLAPLTKPIAANYHRVVLKKEGCGRAFEFLEKLYDLHQIPETERAMLTGYHHLNCGNYDETIAALEKIPGEKFNNKMRAYLAAAYAKTGKREKALEILERLKKADSTIKFYLMSYVHVALGDSDAAFADLEKGIAARDDRFTRLSSDDFLAPLRSDARFKKLLKKMNLPE